MTGVGVAAFGPSAALAIATTFGTASTGTAISALSGAAATNAALAWLGGGALAAGGGGMVAGNAFLALAGPVGWAIGGVALVGGAAYMHTKNGRVAAEATKQAEEVTTETATLKNAGIEIDQIHNLTEEHAAGIKAHLEHLEGTAPADYRQFSSAQKKELAALQNNVRGLAKLLNRSLA